MLDRHQGNSFIDSQKPNLRFALSPSVNQRARNFLCGLTEAKPKTICLGSQKPAGSQKPETNVFGFTEGTGYEATDLDSQKLKTNFLVWLTE